MKTNNKSKKLLSIGSALVAALIVGCSLAVFSAAAETTDSSYGYLAGQKASSERNAKFAKLADLGSDEERESFYKENNISGTYGGSRQLDCEELVKAGIIDEETAAKIAEYAASKHGNIHSFYANMGEMAPQQRHEYFSGRSKDGFDGDVVDELLNAGIITQEQADAINAYLSGK
ncbi:MAG: hypothetical protein ACI4SF_08415 [Oscillospiraceae bacterium]